MWRDKQGAIDSFFGVTKWDQTHNIAIQKKYFKQPEMHQNNRGMKVKQIEGVSGVAQAIHGYMEYIHLFF